MANFDTLHQKSFFFNFCTSFSLQFRFDTTWKTQFCKPWIPRNPLYNYRNQTTGGNKAYERRWWWVFKAEMKNMGNRPVTVSHWATATCYFKPCSWCSLVPFVQYMESQTKTGGFKAYSHSHGQQPTWDRFHLPMSGTMLISFLGIMKVLLTGTSGASSSGVDTK